MKPTLDPARFPNLDLLRLFLACEVVYIHWVALNHHARPGWLIPPVPAFVCISGYLIPASLDNSRGYGHFAWKRLLRVGPGFLLSLLVVLCVNGVGGLGTAILCYLTAGIATTAVDGPLWSLMVEEVLYAFHAASRKLFNPWTVGALVVAACTLWFRYWNVKVGMTGFEYFATIASFFLGNMLYFVRSRIGRSWRLAALSMLALLLAFNMPAVPFGVILLSWPSYMAAFLLKASLPMIVCIGLPQLFLGTRADGRPREMVDISYTIYVLHAPLFGFFIVRGLVEWQLLAAVAASVVAVALPFAILVERRALSLKNSPPIFRRRLSLAEPGIAA